ncbi:RWD-domain-containing protein [Auriculariales sp. MPI-PUGE-AT-0066]|nr:RWD-domain-containing protein [Auriculariales sp. MPI-PUGE-AT-0066]
MSQALADEIELLESIYPTELTKLSDSELSFRVEPAVPPENADDENVMMTLVLRYPPDYPSVLPEMDIECLEGSVTDSERTDLLAGMREQGEQQLGEALTFTLISHLQEQLQSLVESRADQNRKEKLEVERRELEAEEARTRGTPVTPASFATWQANFAQEMKQKKIRDEEEKLKGLTGKEREELKKQNSRPTGRRLFEQDRNLAASDAALAEEDATEVDLSQYDRSKTHEEEEEEQHDRLELSDSD